MALAVYLNKTIAARGALNKDAQVNFEAFSELPLSIVKTVDRQENPVYFNGDSIVFTITLTRGADVQGDIDQITLTDEIPSIVEFDQTDVVITRGTSDPASVSQNNLTIANIVLSDTTPSFEVQVTGTIKIV